MKNLLEPFGFNFGQLQDIATLLKHLRGNGVTTDETINYVNDLKKESEKIAEQRHPERIEFTG